MTSETPVPMWQGFEYLPHQVDGVRWMIEKERYGTTTTTTTLHQSVPPQESQQRQIRGGLQCDEMGLGKTIQVVATMKNNPRETTLIVCPLAMVDTWEKTVRDASIETTVHITNYERLLSSPQTYLSVWWDRIVLDEAHRIRTRRGSVSSLLHKLKATIRWVLTGTPIVNKQRDLFSLLSFLGVEVPSHIDPWAAQSLIEVSKQMMIRRTVAEIRPTTSHLPPPPIIETRRLPFATHEEATLYRDFQARAARTVSVLACMTPLPNPKQNVPFLLLTRLRQISVHPQVYLRSKDPTLPRQQPDILAKATKIAELCRIIEADTDTSKKYLVFCQFKEEMEILREVLGVMPSVGPDAIEAYHGSLSQSVRTSVLRRAKSPSCSVLLMQIQCGGVGLNLQEFTRCVFMSPWWTAAMMDQAVARCVRIGQREQVRVYHLILEEEDTFNIDTFMMDKIHEKRQLLEKIYSTG